MTTTVKVIAHSRADDYAETGREIITFQLRYPRFIHAEFMTHRMFSRNASSSRAIPVETMIANIIADTAMPGHWGRDQAGMQADEEQSTFIDMGMVVGDEGDMFTCVESFTPVQAWCEARDRAIDVARAFHKAKYHKQVVNRILEPFMHIDVIVTATSFDNFYGLRCHADAQPEIRVLAEAMHAAHAASTPKILEDGDWHLPYIMPEEYYSNAFTIDQLIQMSVARCARVSYLTHDGNTPSFASDLKLYERLVGSVPLHASPAEHQVRLDAYDVDGYEHPELSGNFAEGFIQFRKTLGGEYISDFVAA